MKHPRRVLIELEGTLSTPNAAKTSQRGYILTGNEAEPAPDQVARRSL